jgi:Ca2+/Na+ antiporter
MLTHVGLFILGLFLILKGGGLFVDSSTGIAARLKIPRFIIGWSTTARFVRPISKV